MSRQFLKLNPEGMLGAHIFKKNLNFQMILASYSEYEEVQIQYLSNNYESLHLSSEDLGRWCISHKIQYQFLYPIQFTSVIKNPYKYYKFLELKMKLKNLSQQQK